MTLGEEIADWLIELHKTHGWSKRQLAERIDTSHADAVKELVEALKRITATYKRALNAMPVRDASEVLAECDKALAPYVGKDGE